MRRRLKGGAASGVLLDVDGTLVDSAYLHTMAWWQAFRQTSIDVPMARIHRCVGMGGPRLVDSLLPEERDKTLRRQLSCRPTRGYSARTGRPCARSTEPRNLLAQCYESGLAVALASSAKDGDLEALRSTLAADSFIHAATAPTMPGKQTRAGHPGGGAGAADGPSRRPRILGGGCRVGRAGGQQARHPHDRGHLRWREQAEGFRGGRRRRSLRRFPASSWTASRDSAIGRLLGR